MGRALLITLAAVMVALSYTFIGMNSQGKAMDERNVNSHSKAMAKNTAHTGVQLAIEEYNNRKSDGIPDNEEFSNISKSADNANLQLSLTESSEMINGESTEIITIISKSNYSSVEHEVVATFDVSQKQSLLPDFVSAISVANGNVDFTMNSNSTTINGIDDTGDCQMNAPGITVPNQNDIDQDIALTKAYQNGNISGNPAAKVDNSINFSEMSELIDNLSNQPGAEFLNGGTYNDNLGSETDPGIFIVEHPTKIQSNGIGYGILIIKSGGELELEGQLDLRGKFEFNGLVIFENAYNFDSKGTPNINGSVIFGVEDNVFTNTDIDIGGTVEYQFDCDAKKYADNAVDKVLNTTLYQRLSIYE